MIVVRFFFPTYLDTATMVCEDKLKKISEYIDPEQRNSFLAMCENKDCDRINRILEKNLKSLLGSDNIDLGLMELAKKFGIDLSGTVTEKDKILVLGKFSEDMLHTIHQTNSTQK